MSRRPSQGEGARSGAPSGGAEVGAAWTGAAARAGVGEPRSLRGRLAVLAAVAVGLGLLVAREVPRRLGPPAPRARADPLVAIDPVAVREVEVLRAGTRGVFRRSADGWALEAQSGAPVPATDLVEGLLAALRGSSRLAQFSEPDLAPFGLDPPRSEIVLRGPSEQRILLGNRNPPLTALYVQIWPGTEIVLTGSVLLWELDKLVGLVAREGGARPTGAAGPADRR